MFDVVQWIFLYVNLIKFRLQTNYTFRKLESNLQIHLYRMYFHEFVVTDATQWIEEKIKI